MAAGEPVVVVHEQLQTDQNRADLKVLQVVA